MAETIIQWITHASVLIKKNDYYLITDPWYCSKAFTTWTVKPAPIINPNFISDLTNSGKLGFLISHHHFDHYDLVFLKKCNKNTPIFIVDFEKDDENNLPEVKALFNSLKNDCLMNNIHEIKVGLNVNFGPFKIHGFRRNIPYVIDGILCIETDKEFFVHGADCWGFKKNSYEGNIFEKIKPINKFSIFMGQGGTASGWPIIYNNYSFEEKINILANKNKNMLKNILQTCLDFNIDKALPYAHLSSVYLNDKDILKEYNYKPISGKEANILLETNIFLEIEPSSLIIFEEEIKIINIFDIFNNYNYFKDNMIGNEIQKYSFTDENKIIIDNYLFELNNFIQDKINTKKVLTNDVNINFIIKIHDDNDINKIVYSNSIQLVDGLREKQLICSETIIGNIINKKIPFKDLDVGYLANFIRNPDYYNSIFLMLLSEFSHNFFKCNIENYYD